jgi:hypothetical protein
MSYGMTLRSRRRCELLDRADEVTDALQRVPELSRGEVETLATGRSLLEHG